MRRFDKERKNKILFGWVVGSDGSSERQRWVTYGGVD